MGIRLFIGHYKIRLNSPIHHPFLKEIEDKFKTSFKMHINGLYDLSISGGTVVLWQ